MTTANNLASTFWSVETFVPLAGIGGPILLLLLLWFIYRRAGSLYFLRDLILGLFGDPPWFHTLL
ncbi:hypothetical protein, partial [Pseudomonas putida]|uniref:hypothetical protein n=1 Tax=Pseudomonas putida TaxID=303 RepID=UPI00390680C5